MSLRGASAGQWRPHNGHQSAMRVGVCASITPTGRVQAGQTMPVRIGAVPRGLRSDLIRQIVHENGSDALPRIENGEATNGATNSREVLWRAPGRGRTERRV